jgi:hypothetical protein
MVTNQAERVWLVPPKFWGAAIRNQWTCDGQATLEPF